MHDNTDDVTRNSFEVNIVHHEECLLLFQSQTMLAHNRRYLTRFVKRVCFHEKTAFLNLFGKWAVRFGELSTVFQRRTCKPLTCSLSLWPFDSCHRNLWLEFKWSTTHFEDQVRVGSFVSYQRTMLPEKYWAGRPVLMTRNKSETKTCWVARQADSSGRRWNKSRAHEHIGNEKLAYYSFCIPPFVV